MLRRLVVFIPILSALTHDITAPANGKTTTPPMRLYLPLVGNRFYADTSPLQVSAIADSITASWDWSTGPAPVIPSWDVIP